MRGAGAGTGLIVLMLLGMALGFPIVFAALHLCGKTCMPF